MTELTCAVLLGASEFDFKSFGPGPAFWNSKTDILRYLQDFDGGFRLANSQILDLFNSAEPASKQLLAISDFLEQIDRAWPETQVNVILYYVGHGFPGAHLDFYLALRPTREGIDYTSLKMLDLADCVKTSASRFRRFVILDCCFSAQALDAFQTSAADVLTQQSNSAFKAGAIRHQDNPKRGTSLLCAADKDKPALAPGQLRRTMFTNALLDVLEQGDANKNGHLTLAEVKSLVWTRLKTLHPEPVRPILHSPDQSEGDIAECVMFFPNPKHAVPSKGSPFYGAQGAAAKTSAWEIPRDDVREELAAHDQSAPNLRSNNPQNSAAPDTLVNMSTAGAAQCPDSEKRFWPQKIGRWSRDNRFGVILGSGLAAVIFTGWGLSSAKTSVFPIWLVYTTLMNWGHWWLLRDVFTAFKVWSGCMLLGLVWGYVANPPEQESAFPIAAIMLAGLFFVQLAPFYGYMLYIQESRDGLK